MKNLLWYSMLLMPVFSKAQILYQDFNTSLGLGTCWGQSTTTGVVFRQTTPPATNVHEGSGALGMYSCCGIPGQAAMYISPELPDGSHDVSFWVKSSSAGCGPTLDIGICGTAGANFEIAESVSGWPNPAAWFFFSTSVVTNSAQKRIALQEPLGGSCTIFIDELTITNVGEPDDCEEFVLPVQLPDFKAFKKEKSIHLVWQSTMETRFKGYNVERSANGLGFIALAYITAKGSNSLYFFDDPQPLPGPNYYRLKMLDYDGSATYSDVIRITSDDSKPNFQLFPVPAREEITLQWEAEQVGENVLIQIIDPFGRVLLEQENYSSKGIQTTNIALSNLPQGSYYVSCKGTYLRFVKHD